MKKWKYLFIIAILLYSAYKLIPTVQYYGMAASARDSLTAEEKDKYIGSAIKLGLDLQGGMHLVLEVDDSTLDDDAKKDAVDRTLKILRNRIDQFGVAEPVIQKQGNRRIIVQLPGLQDAERAKELIGRTALLEFRLVRDSEELQQVVRELDRELKGIKLVGTRVDTTGIETDTTSVDTPPAPGSTDAPPAGDTKVATPLDTLLPTMPGGQDIEIPLIVDEDRPFSSYLKTLSLGALVVESSNKQAVEILLGTPQAQGALPRKSEFLWGTEEKPMQDGGTGWLLYLVDKDPTLTGASLVNASTSPNPDDPSTLNVSFKLDRRGALVFSRFTGENIGRQIAIVLDKRVRSAPAVETKIPGGEGRITGSFTDEEANDLAIVLRAGALPAPVEIKEERTVGPTLGRDSITLGVKAAIYGFIVVLIFMMVYYQFSGFLAGIALVLNLGIVLAALAALHAALTLPGIAGLILTIGMAVDANVLIFERIREELAKAKTVRSAIDSGYDRAFTTILDANITTLITAFVLWQFGTGPIKGFATVLSIGIIASMFTALMCTRVVFEFITARWSLRKLSI
ncbi:MAG: protein translocase subunit SecD [Candidatus Krumholzibacteriia bacterium]